MLDVGGIVSALQRRKWIVAGVSLLVTALVAAVLSRETRTYTATAIVRLSNVREQLTSGVTDRAAGETRSDFKIDPFASELLVLQSREVAARVVDHVGLRLVDERTGSVPTFADSVRVAPNATGMTRVVARRVPGGVELQTSSGMRRLPVGTRGNFGEGELVVRRPLDSDSVPLRVISRDEAAAFVMKGLSARLRPGTDVIEVTFTSLDRESAPRIVNAAVDAYSDVSREIVQRTARRRREFLEEQLREAEQRAFSAQGALSSFRLGRQVSNSTQRAAAEEANLVQLEARRSDTETERDLYRSLLTQLETRKAPDGAEVRSLLALPLTGATPYVTSLLTQVGNLLTSHDSLLAIGHLETHPAVQRVDGLLTATLTRLTDATRTQSAALDARLASIDRMRGRSSSAVAQLTPAAAEEDRLVQQAELMRGMLNEVRTEFQRARIAEAVELGRVEVVDYASRSAATPLRRGFKLVLGAGTGLLLAVALALLIDRRKTVIRSREEIERLLRIPALAVTRQLGGGNEIRSRGKLSAPRFGRERAALTPTVRRSDAISDVVVAARPDTLQGESFRSIRTRLMFAQGQRGIRTLLVTSASAGDGKTVSAANLAASFAEQGLRVLLVDCDLRRPRMHELFGSSRGPGVSDVLAQTVPPQGAIRATAVDGLSILPSGTLAVGSAELLGGGRMAVLLNWLMEEFDFVILDSPPVLACTDAAVLATMTDGVLMVVRAGKTAPDAAREAVAQMVTVGGRVVGAVLNDPDGETGGSEASYTYGYAYAS